MNIGITRSDKHVSGFHQFLWMLIMAVALSSSGGVAVRYVLPVPWMTSRLHTVTRNIGDAKRAYILKVTAYGTARP